MTIWANTEWSIKQADIAEQVICCHVATAELMFSLPCTNTHLAMALLIVCDYILAARSLVC